MLIFISLVYIKKLSWIWFCFAEDMTRIFPEAWEITCRPHMLFSSWNLHYKHLIYGSFKSPEHPKICQLTFIYYQFSLVWAEVTPSFILHHYHIHYYLPIFFFIMWSINVPFKPHAAWRYYSFYFPSFAFHFLC